MKRLLFTVWVGFSFIFPNSLLAQSKIGRLTLDSTPKSQLFIDGNPYGKTPKKNHKLTVGSHEIRFKKAGEEVQVTIQVKEGKTLSCTHSFETGATECGSQLSLKES